MDTIVIDMGSKTTRIGYGGQPDPFRIFPTIIATVKGFYSSEYYMGDDLGSYWNRIVGLVEPVSRGEIEIQDSMNDVFHCCFYGDNCAIPSEEHPITLTENPLNPKNKKQTICELMFESFNTPMLRTIHSGVASLVSHGRTSGLSIQMGGGQTSISPIYEGCALDYATETTTAISAESLIAGLSKDWNDVVRQKIVFSASQNSIVNNDCYSNWSGNPLINPLSLIICYRRILEKYSQLTETLEGCKIDI